MGIIDEMKSAYGNHFQDLFSKLMKEKYGMQYKPTSTNGNIGDLCVDGVLNYNTAFAVYAPETYNDSKTIEKLKADFNGFLSQRKNGYWNDIETYIFVIKRERTGITSTVLNLISEFRHIFSVDLMTLDDLEMLDNQYLPFSENGKLLEEFKSDVTSIMEYIIETDFSAEPFSINLSDNIELGIVAKWKKKKYVFKEEKCENLKIRILESLCELCSYLTPIYVHALPDGRLLFNNDSWEAGERLRNELQPNIYRIRCNIRDLLEELYSIA